jgi:tellurite resistance protein
MTAPRAQLSPTALAQLPSAIAALVPKHDDRFLAALELGYLAASADGLDARERQALSAILERATGSEIDHATFDAHFYDLDAAVAMLGRRERLARTAADFDTEDTRAKAIQFAALVAMADGALHQPELDVLVEIGTYFQWSADKIGGLVDDIAKRVGVAS